MNNPVVRVILLMMTYATCVALLLSSVNQEQILLRVGLLGCYMFGPALACLFVAKPDWIQIKQGASVFVTKVNTLTLIMPISFYLSFMLITIFIIYVLGNVLGVAGFGRVDLSEASFLKNLQSLVQPKIPLRASLLPRPDVLFALGIVGGILSGLSINLIFALGEEICWRGFLFDRLSRHGSIRRSFIIGSIWGVWHIPIVLLGYNFPGTPVLGSITMIVLCIVLSLVLSIVKTQTKTLLAPAALHGMINGGAPSTLLIVADANRMVGSVVGVAGISAALLSWLIYKLFFDKN